MRAFCERHGLDFEAFWPEREGYELPEEPTPEIDRLTELPDLLTDEQ